jgi:hypothetical protein
MYLKEITTSPTPKYNPIGVIDYPNGKIDIQSLTIMNFLDHTGVQLYASTKHIDITAIENNVIEIDLGSVDITVTPV